MSESVFCEVMLFLNEEEYMAFEKADCSCFSCDTQPCVK